MGNYGNYYDKSGKPLEFTQWALLFNNMSYRRVAITHVGDHTVSTVWLGIEGSPLHHNQPPHIFETMVFNGAVFEEEQERYATLAEAKGGHKRWVKWLALRQPAGEVK